MFIEKETKQAKISNKFSPNFNKQLQIVLKFSIILSFTRSSISTIYKIKDRFTKGPVVK